MALFGSSRDISMFRHINKELINDIIQTEIDFFKLNLDETEVNVYGEAPSKKSYYLPVRLACLITKEDIINTTDVNGVDTDQNITFGFLRDGTLNEINLVPEVGDIINWDERYFEVTNVNINQYILGKNDLTNKTVGSEFGSNWSYICNTILTRQSSLLIDNIRFGS
jgi:hypothetical protein